MMTEKSLNQIKITLFSNIRIVQGAISQDEFDLLGLRKFTTIILAVTAVVMKVIAEFRGVLGS